MRPTVRIAAATAGVLLVCGVAPAQVFLPTHGGFGQRQGFYFHVRNGPFSSLTYVGGAYAFGYGPVVPSYYGPVGAPYWGNPYPPQPVVIQNIIQPPPVVAGPVVRAGGVVIPPEFEQPAAKAAAKAPKLGPAPRPPDAVPPPPPKQPAPLLGQADADRIVEAGRKAFAAGEYGRALELFRKAAEITPNEPSAHFLVSQALFALGKYREAVAAVAAGMSLRADWSEARFVPRDLYWKKPAVYDDHVQSLREALAAFPNDPALLFLLGHQLWFDGKLEEARMLILKAREVGRGQTPAEAFVGK